MKKILFLFMMISLIGLAACSDDSSKEKENTEPQQEENNQSSNVSDDPMEVGDKSNDIDTIETELGETFKVIAWYTSDDTDDKGFNEMDFKGYKVKFSMAAVEDEEGSEYVGFFTETENTTDKPVQYNGDMEIVTDTKDQTENEDGIGDSKPGVKLKGFSVAPLEYGIPDSYTVTFDPPFLNEDENLPEEGHFGDPVEMKFHKE